MQNKFHGIVSISLLGISFLIGLFAVLTTSITMGLIYLFLIVSLFLVIVYSYCCKCSCREHSCGHVLPGKITKYLPKRKQSKYTTLDILSVLVSFLIMVIFPQFWLFKNLLLLLAFWSLLIIAIMEILLLVCTVCKNEKCALCKANKS